MSVFSSWFQTSQGSKASKVKVPECCLPPMDERFPVPHPSLSYWHQGVRSNSLLDHRSTQELPDCADVVIVGSGMSGCLIAHELLHSSSTSKPKSVVMISAREFCDGATGRNAGHCKPDCYRGYAKYKERFGEEQAKKILENEWQTYTNLSSFVREHNVDCDLWTGQTLDVTMSEEVAKKYSSVFHMALEDGVDVHGVKETLDEKEAVEIFRLRGAKAVWSWEAGSFYPWKLCAHLAKESLPLGLNLQTYTTATSITPSSTSRQWVVTTDRGSITAPKVVHATNAFASTLLPSNLEPLISPHVHICNKVVPPLSYSGSKALKSTYAILLRGDQYVTINSRTNSDGVLLFGGEGTRQADLEELLRAHPELKGDDRLGDYKPMREAVEELVEREFVGWSSGRRGNAVGEGYEYNWSGVIGRSADTLPFVGRVPGGGMEGQWVCAGFHGHGMARIFTCATALARMMLDSEMQFEETGLPEVFEATVERVDRILAKSGPTV